VRSFENARSTVDRNDTRLRLAAKQSRRRSSILYPPSSFNYPPRRANLTRRIHQDLEKIRADFQKIFQILHAFPDFAQKKQMWHPAVRRRRRRRRDPAGRTSNSIPEGSQQLAGG
jgi:hypothetical protein